MLRLQTTAARDYPARVVVALPGYGPGDLSALTLTAGFLPGPGPGGSYLGPRVGPVAGTLDETDPDAVTAEFALTGAEVALSVGAVVVHGVTAGGDPVTLVHDEVRVEDVGAVAPGTPPQVAPLGGDAPAGAPVGGGSVEFATDAEIQAILDAI